MTRSHKFNDRDHSGEAVDQEHLPKFFAKHGFADTDPRKTKKDGGGKGNWGRPGDEVEVSNMTNPRRRSNSSTAAKSAAAFKTKFETIEPEPVFEMSEHGPVIDDDDAPSRTSQDTTDEGHRLVHQSTASSVATSAGESVEEEHA